MNSELRALIDDFRTTQDRAIDYLHAQLLIPLPTSGREWVQTGHRAVLEAARRPGNCTIKLEPHGFGIEVVHPDFRIDFDYGPNGEIDCFDLWRLAVHRYHLSNAQPPVGPYDDIRAWVEEAISRYLLRIVPESNDAYFQDPTRLRSPASVI